MVNLVEYRKFWEDAINGVGSVTEVLPVTLDKEMSKKIQSLKGGSLTLFVLPPVAEMEARNADSVREVNHSVVFLMERYDPMRKPSFSVLEETQQVAEDLKRVLVRTNQLPCSAFKVDLNSVEIAPETELFGVFAGWSITFDMYIHGNE